MFSSVKGVVALTVVALVAIACSKDAPHADIPAPIPIVSWAERVDTLPGTYTGANSVAEFWDSVVVITDGPERLVWRVSLSTGARTTMSSRGGGPGEYQYAGQAVKLHADSVALLQVLSQPFPVLSVATGRGRTFSAYNDVSNLKVATALRIGAPDWRYADSLGHLFGAPFSRTPTITDHATGRSDPRTRGSLDTFPVVRLNTASYRADTLLQLSNGVMRGRTGREADGAMTFALEMDSYGAYNDWLPISGGRVLVADGASYLLSIRDSTGAVTKEFRVPSNPVSVSAKGWDAYVQMRTKGSIAGMKKLNEQAFAAAGVKMPAMPATRYRVPEMPAVLPPLNFGSLQRHMHEYGGIVWIPVNLVDPPGAQFWDLVDLTRGARVGTVALPAKQYLLHVTALGAYVVAIDDDDLSRVLLYRRKNSAQ